MERKNRNKYLTTAILATILMFSAMLQSNFLIHYTLNVSAESSVEIIDVTFGQLDWYNPDGELVVENSIWGYVAFEYILDGTDVYYLNVVASVAEGEYQPSWVVQNMPLWPLDVPISRQGTHFDLEEIGILSGMDLSYIDVIISIDPEIQNTEPSGFREVFEVKDIDQNAWNDNGPDLPDVPFEDPGKPDGVKNEDDILEEEKRRFIASARDLNSVQEDVGQCFSGAVARSLDWLNRVYELGINNDVDQFYDAMKKEVENPQGKDGPEKETWKIKKKNEYAKKVSKNKIVTKIYDASNNNQNNVGSIPSVNEVTAADESLFDFLKRETEDNDVELAFYYRSGRRASHVVTVVGVYETRDGKFKVVYRDDETQGNDQVGDGQMNKEVELKHKQDCNYSFGTSSTNVWYAMSEAVVKPQEMTSAQEGKPTSVDPARASDDASCEMIANVYEPLVRFGQTNPRDVFDAFVPCLATDWTISDDGLTYDFKLRENVLWHNLTYGFVTAEDVEYSFERAMVHDKDPAWLLYEPLLGTHGADTTDPVGQGKAIDDAVTVDGDTVSFHLKRPDTPYAPYTPFIRILAQPVCSAIVCKQWCIDQGDWPGTWDNWMNYHDLGVSLLDDPEPEMMGTGPYMLDYWDKDVEYSLIKFDDYWGDWPAPGSRGYVERVTVQFVDDWAVRRDGFLADVYDIVDVPRDNIDEAFCEPGTDCIYPLWPLLVNSLLFKYQISSTSPYLGPGFNPADPYAFGEDRIRVDFFSDIDVRKAFAYSFDGTTFIQGIFLCEATERPTPVIPDLPYYNSSIPIYEFNLTKAEEHFRYAWGGELWEQGFTFTIPYIGLWRGKVCEIIKTNVESLNPRFHIECMEITWLTYIDQLNNCELPIFMLGWCADYPDPHNLVHTFMHSEGAYASSQRIQYGQSGRKQIAPYGDPTKVINNTYVDALIETGLTTPDGAERERIYHELQQIYHEECLSVFLCQPIHRHFERTWVNGWYFNQQTCGHYLYFYTMWKEDLPIEDINEDGSVNIVDIGIAASAFGSDYRLCADIHPTWYSRADINCDQIVNIVDISTIALNFGYVAPPWTPP